MNLWKAGALVIFGVINGLGLSIAQADSNQQLWQSSAFLGGCRLQAEFSSKDSSVRFTPSSESRTKFIGLWPKKAGEVYMESRVRVPREQAIEGAEVLPAETLCVTFADVNGELQPVGYVYDNVKSRSQSRLIQPKPCSSLVKVN